MRRKARTLIKYRFYNRLQQEVSQHCIDTWNNITQLAITVHFAFTSSYVTRECHERLRERLADICSSNIIRSAIDGRII